MATIYLTEMYCKWRPLRYLSLLKTELMDDILNIVRQFVGDPAGCYKYLGELEKGKHFVSYMFTDDASDGDVMLCVGTYQYLVVEGGKCRHINDKESVIVMKYIAENLENEI